MSVTDYKQAIKERENNMHDTPIANMAAKPPGIINELTAQTQDALTQLDDSIRVLMQKLDFILDQASDSKGETMSTDPSDARSHIEASMQNTIQRINWARAAVQEISDRVRL